VSGTLGAPDRQWYGASPFVLAELRGEAAERAIPKLQTAIASYPYQHEYRVWPGPNSNTFTAMVAREVPSLRLDLPATAIGKDYLGPTQFIERAPSGTGYQLSVLGLLGFMAAVDEGLEANFLGLTFGVDFNDASLKVPGFGRL
jgi:hypothetical protein